MTAEVMDPVGAVGVGTEFGVPPRDDEIGDDDVVVGGTADPDAVGRQRSDGGRLPEGAGGGGVRDGGEPGRCVPAGQGSVATGQGAGRRWGLGLGVGRGLELGLRPGQGLGLRLGLGRGRGLGCVQGLRHGRGLRDGLRCVDGIRHGQGLRDGVRSHLGFRRRRGIRCDRGLLYGRRRGGGSRFRRTGLRPRRQHRARPVLRVSEPYDRPGAHLPRPGHPQAVREGAVGAALVHQGPVAVGGAEHRVVPGRAGVREDEVAGGVAPDAIGAARIHACCVPVDLEDQIRRRGRDGSLSHA